jgi:hypothetical protein
MSMKNRLLCLRIGALIISTALQGCNGSPSPPPGEFLFFEDFQTYPLGSPPGGGWFVANPDYHSIEIKYSPDQKLYIEGPDIPEDEVDKRPAVFYELSKDGIMPNYISFKVHPFPQADGESVAWFSLRGEFQNNPGLHTVISIGFIHVAPGIGKIFVGPEQYPDGAAIDVDQAFRFELKDIDWSAYPDPTFSVYINGKLRDLCLRFNRPLKGFNRLDLLNINNSVATFDDIVMKKTDVEHVCIPPLPEPPTPPEPSVVPLPPPPTSTVTVGRPEFYVELGAFCRQGPGMLYGIITTFQKGTRLMVNGSNLEQSWWWIEEHRCWISDAVGTLSGSMEDIPIREAPSLPAPTSPPSPEALECRQGLSEDECLKAGGSWNPGPAEAPHCDCP